MKHLISLLIVFGGLTSALFAQNDSQRIILDKMYNDILQSLPLSERHIVDSAYSVTQKKQGKNESTSSPLLNDSIAPGVNRNLPPALNEDLNKMIHQIDTMRQKRMIHFMTNEQTSE